MCESSLSPTHLSLSYRARVTAKFLKAYTHVPREYPITLRESIYSRDALKGLKR